MSCRLWLIALFTALFSFSSFAFYEIIPYHSKISFIVDYMKVASVEGRFKIIEGVVDWDPQKRDLKKVTVLIKTASLDSGDTKRDDHLRREDFFFVNNYPEAYFESLAIKKIDSQHFVVSGTLFLRGVKKTIALNTFYRGSAKDHTGKVSEFFEASADLDRKDFKMIWNKNLDTGGVLVGDKVKLRAQIQLQLSNGKTAYSTHMIPSNPVLDGKYRLHPVTKIPEPQLTAAPTAMPTAVKQQLKEQVKEVPWWKYLLGFILFIVFAVASYFIKLKLMKMSDQAYNENSARSILLDLVVIIINVGYAVWLYNFLYST